MIETSLCCCFQSLSCVWLFTTSWTQHAWLPCPSPNCVSQSLLRLMSMESVMHPTILSSVVPFSSVQFSCSVMSDSLWPHGLQHTRPPCPSPTPGVHSNSCPSSRWCHPTISSSVLPFSSHLECFPASGSFPMSQFFASGGQTIGVSASASVLPVNIQDWFPSGWTSWISLQSKGLSRIFLLQCHSLKASILW